MRKLLLGLAAVFFCATAGAVSVSEINAYPTRPVRLVVPFASGGLTDVIARQMAQGLEAILKQPVQVENRTGAGATIGTELVAKAQPDGYTLLWATFSHAINATRYKSLPYDSLNDFAPVSMVANTYLTLATTRSTPAQTVHEFIEAVKTAPVEFNFGSGGVGSSMHLAAALFNERAGLPEDILHIPYRAGPLVVPALVGGDVRYAFLGVDQAVPLVREGKLKALAVTSPQRDPFLPEVPTLQEAGLKDFEVGIYLMVLAPRDTPPAIVDKLYQAINIVLESPAFVHTTDNMAGVRRLPGYTPDMTRRFIRDEIYRWAPIIKATGARVE